MDGIIATIIAAVLACITFWGIGAFLHLYK
jgi:hypothetical protein